MWGAAFLADAVRRRHRRRVPVLIAGVSPMLAGLLLCRLTGDWVERKWRRARREPSLRGRSPDAYSYFETPSMEHISLELYLGETHAVLESETADEPVAARE